MESTPRDSHRVPPQYRRVRSEAPTAWGPTTGGPRRCHLRADVETATDRRERLQELGSVGCGPAEECTHARPVFEPGYIEKLILYRPRSEDSGGSGYRGSASTTRGIDEPSSRSVTARCGSLRRNACRDCARCGNCRRSWNARRGSRKFLSRGTDRDRGREWPGKLTSLPHSHSGPAE